MSNSEPPQESKTPEPVPSELKRELLRELAKSPIAIGVAVVTALIIAYLGIGTREAPSSNPTASPTAPQSVSVLAFTPTLPAPTVEKPPSNPQATLVWQEFLDAELYSDCPSRRLLPSNLIPENGILDIEAIDQAFFDLLKAPTLPEPTSGLKAIFRINSKPENQNWLRLDHSIQANISATQNVSDHHSAVLLSGCGGAGTTREFPAIQLDSTYLTYQAETTYPSADFFTLQPGEFEEFHISFQCVKPGLYEIHVEIPFRHVNQQGTASNQLTIVCPKAFTVWDAEDRTGVTSAMYRWNEKEYVQEK